MDDRTVCLQVGAGCYGVGAAPDGGLAIKGLPADARRCRRCCPRAATLESQTPLQPFVDILYLALALIIMGVGFLKANISSIVGQLYPQGDPRRDPGFTLYYYGINLGAFWAAVALRPAGPDRRLVRPASAWPASACWPACWCSCSGKPLLEGHGEPPEPAALARPVLGPLSLEWLIYLAGLVGRRRRLAAGAAVTR